VRGIHVEPNAVLTAEGADRLEVVVQAGAGGARRRHERHRAHPGTLRGGERCLEPLRHDALVLIHIQRKERSLAKPQHGHAALDRVMGGLRREHRQPAVDPIGPRVGGRLRPRRQQRGEIGERAAVRQDASGAGLPAHPLDHPLDHRGLHRVGRGTHLVHGHRLVRRAVHQVSKGRWNVRRGDLMRQLTRVVQTRGAREHLGEPGREGVLAEPALTDQPPQLELLRKLVRRRRGHNLPLARLALLDVAGEDRDRGVRQPLVLCDVPDHGR